jgi:hypothetical protein
MWPFIEFIEFAVSIPCSQKSTMNHILSQMNPVHTLTHHFQSSTSLLALELNAWYDVQEMRI